MPKKMTGQMVILAGGEQRDLAVSIIREAPPGSVVTIEPPKRTLDQNALLWAMLSDVSRQVSHNGNRLIPEVWKCLFMAAHGEEANWIDGIDGGAPICLGFRSSKMSKALAGDLITFIFAWGARHGVRWTGSSPNERL